MPSLNNTARNYMADAVGTGFGTATLTILAGATTLATHTRLVLLLRPAV